MKLNKEKRIRHVKTFQMAALRRGINDAEKALDDGDIRRAIEELQLMCSKIETNVVPLLRTGDIDVVL